MADHEKLPLNTFLQVLTSKNLSVSRAMTVASKIYKDFNTPARLGELTDPKLLSLGISDKEDRTLVLSALNAAGYRAVSVSNAKQREAASKKRRAANRTPEADADPDLTPLTKLTTKRAPPSPSPLPASPSPSRPPHKKRKRRDGTVKGTGSSSSSSRVVVANEYMPDLPVDEGAALDGFEFHELLDEDALMHKSALVNRAPVMMAWACVVSERLGFSREEALSIASVYTEMNAISKGVSLGIYDKKREAHFNAMHASGGTQPYVDLLGRRVPLYRTASGTWRAFTTEDSSANSTPGGGGVSPGAAYSYITHALRQTVPAVLGAMRLLAESYDPVELNRIGFGLYADFRPDVSGWGKRGELKCETLLSLRMKGKSGRASSDTGMVGDRGEADVKLEGLDKEHAHSALDKASDGASPGMEPNDLIDVASLDEFTSEELSLLP
ncbi:hypothetical protein F5148DRAFT_980691 [Russula earlei]|uniref:Uncharacterized protein n=1 Tax=Russula earlei TaxID=71964 RepID=A0ACC0U8E4_9AGAM|nr:hypothetical protein F5148DRAFT_980691 [Russula earlei]